MLFLMEQDTVHSILNIYTLGSSDSRMGLKGRSLKYFHIIYMGYLNGHSNSIETSQKVEKGERGVGFALTADEHYHLKGKRLTNVSAPVHNHDATTKKFVTDLLKTKAGTTYVNNELAALTIKVSKLEATVGRLQKAAEQQQKPVSE